MEVAPGARQKVAMEAGDDDHETLEPHADISGDANDEHHRNTAAHRTNPVALRDQHVAGNHGPVGPIIRPESAVDEGESLIAVAAVPGDEELAGIGVTDD